MSQLFGPEGIIVDNRSFLASDIENFDLGGIEVEVVFHTPVV